MRPLNAIGTVKRKDSKDSLPVGIMFANVYCGNGVVLPKARIRAYAKGGYKSFSLNKYGQAKAIELAIAWRHDKLSK